MSKNNDKINELDSLYDLAKVEGGNLTDSIPLMNPDDINPHDANVIYSEDFDAIQKETLEKSKCVIHNMAELYFDNNQTILDNKYIKNKIDNDAQNLSDLTFLQNIAKKAIIKQMQQIDVSDSSPRLFETMFQGMKEVQNIIKQSTIMTSTMQNFYKELNNDLKEHVGEHTDIEMGSDKEEHNIYNTTDLNNKLEELIAKNKNL